MKYNLTSVLNISTYYYHLVYTGSIQFSIGVSWDGFGTGGIMSDDIWTGEAYFNAGSYSVLL